eukprot:CAMPEP_0198262838 /NCGR_PEP_ID=MMETSP1447-20131203/11293_1 /TAXON_ID=420782 /ORGANISM="Chaetoceros dichaeta, Strain CCMP1751" /LENGTH=119 /DNA_ID=CAMNT_0043951235 /DNA_START=75 /DNA_END=431 /DNA_ORIENTATION=-
MIVGEERAGKTGLANSIMGKSFEMTESTVGINELKIEVKYAYRFNKKTEKGKGGNWNAYKKPEKELETAIAQMVLDQEYYLPVTQTTDTAEKKTGRKKKMGHKKASPDVNNELVMKCVA